MSNHTETAQIIPLFGPRPKLGKRIGVSATPISNSPKLGELTETAKNSRLRRARYDDWRKADVLRQYWRASLKMLDAIACVQNHNQPEGDLHPEYKPQERWTMVAKWRAAIVAQLLTPAPTMREITWKRAIFKDGDCRYTDVTPQRIEQAIADDIAFLKSHPTRRRDLQQ